MPSALLAFHTALKVLQKSEFRDLEMPLAFLRKGMFFEKLVFLRLWSTSEHQSSSLQVGNEHLYVLPTKLTKKLAGMSSNGGRSKKG